MRGAGGGERATPRRHQSTSADRPSAPGVLTWRLAALGVGEQVERLKGGSRPVAGAADRLHTAPGRSWQAGERGGRMASRSARTAGEGSPLQPVHVARGDDRRAINASDPPSASPTPHATARAKSHSPNRPPGANLNPVHPCKAIPHLQPPCQDEERRPGPACPGPACPWGHGLLHTPWGSRQRSDGAAGRPATAGTTAAAAARCRLAPIFRQQHHRAV